MTTRKKLVAAPGVTGLAVCAAVVLIPMLARTADPEDDLHCQADRRQVSVYDYDENYIETRDPQQQAKEWRSAPDRHNKANLVQQSTYQKSATEAKIGYRDSADRMEAVLRFEKRANGWRLTAALECG